MTDRHAPRTDETFLTRPRPGEAPSEDEGPALSTLRELVRLLPRCESFGCNATATCEYRNEPGSGYTRACDNPDHEPGERIDHPMRDLPYAAPLRSFLRAYPPTPTASERPSR